MKEESFLKSMESLMTKGHGEFDIDLKNEDFENLLSSQAEVYKFIRDNNLQDTYCIDSNSREADDTDRGFLERREENGGKDNKDCVHYRLTTRAELEYKLRREITIEDLVDKYLVIARKVYSSLYKLATEIITEVDRRIPQFNILKEFLNPEATDLNTLRTIKYLMSKIDKLVAAFHYDRNFMTMAAYESHQGLYIEENNKLVPYVHKEGKVLVFFSQKAEEFTNGTLKAIVHGVNVFKEGIERLAVILFTHILHPFIHTAKPVPEHLKQVA